MFLRPQVPELPPEFSLPPPSSNKPQLLPLTVETFKSGLVTGLTVGTWPWVKCPLWNHQLHPERGGVT